MEYTSSNRRIIALNILKQIEEAIVKYRSVLLLYIMQTISY